MYDTTQLCPQERKYSYKFKARYSTYRQLLIRMTSVSLLSETPLTYVCFTPFLWWAAKYACMCLLPRDYIDDPKIVNNIVSGLHSTTLTGLSFLSLYRPAYFPIVTTQAVCCLSSGYFLYDTAVLLRKNPLENVGYLYHHFITLYILYQMCHSPSTQSVLLLRLFHLGELSNFWNYVVYHKLKVKSRQKRLLNSRSTGSPVPPLWSRMKLIILKTVQVSWFTYYRIWLFSKTLALSFVQGRMETAFHDLPYFLQFNMLMLYGMGYMWLGGQIQGISK